MWFSNALVYQYEFKESVDLTTALAEEVLKPCPPHARFIYGWLSAYADELVQEVAGCSLICLGKEERILPRGVIKRLLTERIQALEVQQQRTVKRAERAQLAEDLEFELLPKSFCVQKQLFALLDTVSNRLIVNAASNNQASQLTSLLRKSIPGIHIEPLACQENLAMRFAQWISDPSLLPSSFQLASDCLLFSLDDDKKRVSCKGYELPAEEILTLLSQGLAAAEISLIWNDRIQFTLTHDLTFKRLKSLDYLIDEFEDIRQLEEEYQQRDAALTLLSGELRALINDVLSGLSIPHQQVQIASQEEECLA
ncbi:recombination-associated protein RdgC [Legionella jamestowniensis]|uniref:Recombination-associated protein RdgC n=1 Tax=Legionella jamestowniensis TaxID=455 RepID=A0A0W0UGZ3_9GAMM|nr:recombination-associated protein RdgC [Legionella jamestowniensis]KTD06902.1 recombination associated protein [Legionella jamestowniensis]OCH97426.1 recombination-associated protein RdgC [Legionella jamestowniensis]SFL85391.1 recombination associated protein RdgC [Legionella jamestowniensis DSM 19215]